MRGGRSPTRREVSIPARPESVGVSRIRREVSAVSQTPPPPLPFAVQDRVRWSDCDPLGIIYYGTYIRFFEVAEHEMFRAAGLPYEVMRVQRHVQLPRKAFQVEFHSPAEMDELVTIEVGVARIGTTALTMRFEVYRASDRTHRASATLTVVCVTKEGIEKRPLPDFVKEALSPYRVAAP
jgi:acyl-CoA thioester hydrolase